MALPETVDPFNNLECAPNTDWLDTELAIRKNNPYRDDTEELIIQDTLRRYMEPKYSVWKRVRLGVGGEIFRWTLYNKGLERNIASQTADSIKVFSDNQEAWSVDACITIDGINPNG